MAVLRCEMKIQQNELQQSHMFNYTALWPI